MGRVLGGGHVAAEAHPIGGRIRLDCYANQFVSWEGVEASRGSQAFGRPGPGAVLLHAAFADLGWSVIREDPGALEAREDITPSAAINLRP